MANSEEAEKLFSNKYKDLEMEINTIWVYSNNTELNQIPEIYNCPGDSNDERM